MCEKVEKYGDEREKKGRLEGKEEGKYKESIEIAKRMIADNLSLDEVAFYSGLPLSKIEELAL